MILLPFNLVTSLPSYPISMISSKGFLIGSSSGMNVKLVSPIISRAPLAVLSKLHQIMNEQEPTTAMNILMAFEV